jgi:hypothetical protein
MKEQVSGTVSRIGNQNKSIQLTETDEKWYSVYNASQLVECQVGDKLEFFFESKEKGDRVFNNIKGNVTIIESSGRTPPPVATVAGKSKQQDERPPVSMSRCNALTNAVAFSELLIKDGGSTDTDSVLAIAVEFENHLRRPIATSQEEATSEGEGWQEAATKLRAAS